MRPPCAWVAPVFVIAAVANAGLLHHADAGVRDRLPTVSAEAPILAFGDSLTAGVGGSGLDYPQRLHALLDREVIEAGVPGETSAEGRVRLPKVLRETRPGLLILCLGINDLFRGYPRAALRRNLQAMLDQADSARVPVLLLAVPGPGERQPDPLFAGLGRPGKVWVDEHAMADTLLQPALKSDLVHPNREGYRQIAEAVAHSLAVSGALAAERPDAPDQPR